MRTRTHAAYPPPFISRVSAVVQRNLLHGEEAGRTGGMGMLSSPPNDSVIVLSPSFLSFLAVSPTRVRARGKLPIRSLAGERASSCRCSFAVSLWGRDGSEEGYIIMYRRGCCFFSSDWV